MKITELLAEKKMTPPTQSQCDVKGHSLSSMRYSQCVALGLRPHDSDHTDGSGKQGVKGSGKSVRGRKIKSTKYGGTLKYYSGGRN